MPRLETIARGLMREMSICSLFRTNIKPISGGDGKFFDWCISFFVIFVDLPVELHQLEIFVNNHSRLFIHHQLRFEFAGFLTFE